MGWLSSFGIKRYVASALSIIASVLGLVPGAEAIIPLIDQIAGVFGITGISHAAVNGDVTKEKLAGISSFLAFLIALSAFIPQLQPFVPLLQKLAALFGAAGIGALVSKQVSKPVV